MILKIKVVELMMLCSLFSIYAKSALNKHNTQKLRILMVVGRFPAASEIMTLNQITGLVDRGHDIHIYAISKTGDVAQPEVHQYNLLAKVYCYELPPKLETYDAIIIQQGWFINCFLSRAHKYLSKKTKLLVCLRGSDIGVCIRRKLSVYKKLFEQKILFLPVCDFFRKKLITYGALPERIIVLHSAINCAHFRYKPRLLKNEKTINILSTGRFIPKKGIEYAIMAIAKLINTKHYSVNYTIVGRGSAKQQYEQLIKKYKLANHIKIVDWLDHDQLAKRLNEAHIFVSTSVTASNGDWEGIPNALKEAMATGLPVISTYHAGIPELVEDGISGFLVPEKDVDALADKIEYLITHPEMWPQMGAAGRKKVEQDFELHKESDKLEKILLNCVQNK
jgi:colanic acid/amylovoran biosynthesis glycosyltransferase